ncbi:MAG: dihydroorotate dehydrogenase electron transfer subunit [Candidatus Bathyarchaeia archaeon]
MVYPKNIDPRRIVRIVDNKFEAANIRTIFFEDDLCRKARPGQYLMAWIPGVDEVPLSLSTIDHNGLSAVTVKVVGKGTETLCEMRPGEYIGVRGPYGNWFNLVNGRVAIVGGGTGLAPLLPLAKALIELGTEISFIAGGATKKNVLHLAEIQTLLNEQRHNLIVTTDDGSYGREGTVIDAFQDLLEKDKNFDMIYSCGPEPMTRKVFDLSESQGLQLQVCLERIVHCSLGLCGSCVIGRFRVCKDGLILSSEQLREVADEFGVFKRGLDGRKTYFS